MHSKASVGLFLLCAIMVCVGCSMQALTGDTMSAFTVEQVIPETMQSDDVGMACASGEGQTGMLSAFGRVTDRPHRALIMTYMSAGMCSEMRSWEAELQRMIALNEGRVGSVKDALVREKAAHLEAAKRNNESFKHLVAAFGEPGEGCPELTKEKDDELLFLLGLNAGLLSVVHDRGAGGAAGLPLERTRALARAVQCLDNGKWWGVPDALSAAIWTGIPGAAPDGIDPWAQLTASIDVADKANVRLAYAFWIQSLNAAGRADEMCAAVDRYAKTLASNEPAKNYRLLDAYAGRVILHELNKQWIRAVGHRAPAGEFACHAPEPADDGTDDIDQDLLDGVDETD